MRLTATSIFVIAVCFGCNDAQTQVKAPDGSAASGGASTSNGGAGGSASGGSSNSGAVCPNQAGECPEPACVVVSGTQIIGDCRKATQESLGCAQTPATMTGQIGCVKRVSDNAIFAVNSTTYADLLVADSGAWLHCTAEESSTVVTGTVCP